MVSKLANTGKKKTWISVSLILPVQILNYLFIVLKLPEIWQMLCRSLNSCNKLNLVFFFFFFQFGQPNIEREKAMAPHSSTLAWKIPWTEDPGGLQNTGVGQPFPSPVDLPNPGIEPRSPVLQADSLPAEPPGKPQNTGVGSLSLLQGIFLTRNRTGVSCIAGRFFTS